MELYKKYRPDSFDEMLGNGSVIENLKKLIEKKDIHVFLFTGPSGCGKTTAARICTKILDIDILSVMEINSSNNRGIDTARQISEQIKSYPLHGNYWGYILDEIHRGTLDFSNAMLKILEDTPNHVYFFLCTTNPEKLLPALKNRCQIIKFASLSDRDLIRLLRKINRKEEGKADSDVIDEIINLSLGSARKALVLLEKVINEEPDKAIKILKSDDIDIEKEEIKKLCKYLIGRDVSWENIIDILNELKKEDIENIRRAVLGYMSKVLLKGKNNKAALVMEFFQEPFYNTGFPGLILACFQSLYSS